MTVGVERRGTNEAIGSADRQFRPFRSRSTVRLRLQTKKWRTRALCYSSKDSRNRPEYFTKMKALKCKTLFIYSQHNSVVYILRMRVRVPRCPD